MKNLEIILENLKFEKQSIDYVTCWSKCYESLKVIIDIKTDNNDKTYFDDIDIIALEKWTHFDERNEKVLNEFLSGLMILNGLIKK